MKIFLLSSLFIMSLFAHPHTFIEVYPSMKKQDAVSSIVNFKWVLDDMTSSVLIMELDRDGDGVFNVQENREIEKDYFNILEKYHYYTFIMLDKKPLELPKINNFKATIENYRVCYSFDIVLEHNPRDIVFEFGDSDYYIAMILKKEFVDAAGFDVKVSSVDDDLYPGYKLEFQ